MNDAAFILPSPPEPTATPNAYSPPNACFPPTVDSPPEPTATPNADLSPNADSPPNAELSPTFAEAFGRRFRYDFDFNGRATRSEWWGWVCGAIARGFAWTFAFELLPPCVLDFFWVVIAFFFVACSATSGIEFGFLNVSFAFKKTLVMLTPLAALFLLPGLSVSVRRLRDVGESGARFATLAAISTFALAALFEYATGDTDDAKVFAETALVAAAIDGGRLLYLLGFAPGEPGANRFGPAPKSK